MGNPGSNRAVRRRRQRDVPAWRTQLEQAVGYHGRTNGDDRLLGKWVDVLLFLQDPAGGRISPARWTQGLRKCGLIVVSLYNAEALQDSALFYG